MTQSQVKSLPWWAYSLLWAVGTAVVTGALLPSPLRSWRLVLAVAVTVFAILCWRNPKFRYWRLANQILTFWAVSRWGSKLVVFFGWEQGTLAFAFENESSSMFDLSMGACVLIALALDCIVRNGSPFGERIKEGVISVQWIRQTAQTNLGSPTNIAHVGGDVHIHQSSPTPSEKELDDALASPNSTPSASVREGVCHDQIDAAVVYMKEDKVDVAIEFLLRLKRRHWDRMTEREKFRTLANLGHCHSRREDYGQALVDFREALLCQPNDVEARCLVAVAEFSAGNHDEARQLAEQIIADHPDAVHAHVVILKTDSSNESTQLLWERLPHTVRTATAVLFELGWRAASRNEFEFARSLAQKRLEDTQSRTEFEVLEAAITVGEVSPRVINNPPPTDEEAQALKSAIQTLNAAEKCVERTAAKQQLSQVYYYLACAYQLLGENGDAEHAYRQAIKVCPSVTHVGRQYAMFLNRLGRISDAVSELDGSEHHANDIESQVLLAHCLAERNEPGDSERARTLLKRSVARLSEVDLATLSNALNLLGLLDGEEGKADEALEAISSINHADFSQAHQNALAANARRHAGEDDIAEQLAKDAVAGLSDTENETSLWDVAATCKACGLYSEALSVYRKFVTPKSQKRNIMGVLECAHRSEDAKFLLEFCTKLRQHGILLEEAIELEAVTREKFDDVDGAIEVLDAYLTQQRSDYFTKLVQLRKAVLGVKYARPELWDAGLESLPSWEEATGEMGRLVVIVLRKQGRHKAAIEYGYALLRKNFGDPQAHYAFVASVGTPGSEVPHPTFTTAEAGCAVQYEALIGEERGWWILEELRDAQQERHELELTHPTAVDLIGKKVGDEFVLRSSAVQEVKGRIVKIISKYEYRYGEILNEWQDRFPGEFFVWKVEMQKDESGEVDLSPILKSLDNRAKKTEQLDTLYREHLLSITSFSVLSGVDPIDAASHLAGTPDLEIRCCLGNEQEHQNALACTSVANEVVLCPSAVATLWLIRVWQEVDSFPFEVLVSRAVIEQLRRKQEDMSFRSRGFLGKIGEKYVLTETTENDRKRWEDDFNSFYLWLREKTQIVSGLGLAEVSRDLRNDLTEMFGGETAQGIAIAKQRDVPLWTDDLAVAELSRSELGVKRTWSEVVFGSLVANDRLSSDKFADFVAALNGCGYRHTRLTPEVVVAAARRAEWNPEQWPFPAVLDWCRNPAVNPLGVVQIVSFSLPLLWRSAIIPEQAKSITRSLLKAVRQLPGGDEILRAILKHMNDIFKLDVLNGEKCRIVAEQILSNRPPRRLIVPGDSGTEL